MNIGERIKIRLDQLGKSQRELANMTVLTEAAISRYVNNQRTPNATTIERIANALGVSLDYLLDAETLIRCFNCSYWNGVDCIHPNGLAKAKDDGYCMYAERMEDE